MIRAILLAVLFITVVATATLLGLNAGYDMGYRDALIDTLSMIHPMVSA